MPTRVMPPNRDAVPKGFGTAQKRWKPADMVRGDRTWREILRREESRRGPGLYPNIECPQGPREKKARSSPRKTRLHCGGRLNSAPRSPRRSLHHRIVSVRLLHRLPSGLTINKGKCENVSRCDFTKCKACN